MIENLGGRKAVACLLALLVCVVAVVLKGDVPDRLMEMVKYIITTYLAGNVAADVVAAVQTKVEGTAAAKAQEAAPTPLSGGLDSPYKNYDAVSIMTAIDRNSHDELESVKALRAVVESQGTAHAAAITACQQGLSYIINRMNGNPTPQG